MVDLKNRDWCRDLAIFVWQYKTSESVVQILCSCRAWIVGTVAAFGSSEVQLETTDVELELSLSWSDLDIMRGVCCYEAVES